MTLVVVAAVGLAMAGTVLVRRIRRADRRIAALEADVRALTARLEDLGGDARAAVLAARRAAAAAGVDDPPRLPLEPVTGKVVRAVAFSAGARRVLARLAAPRVPRRSSVA